MRELSEIETESVSAAFGVPGSVLGGVVGGMSYLGSSITSQSFSYQGLAASVGVGAALGFIGGPVTSSARAYFMPRAGLGGGMIEGAAESS